MVKYAINILASFYFEGSQNLNFLVKKNSFDQEELTTSFKNPFCTRSSNLHGVEIYLPRVPSEAPRAICQVSADSYST